MTDPYKVLGVSPDATEEQIKHAYRELAKQYQFDPGQDGSPSAQKKMDRLNEAYDQIIKARATSGKWSYSAGQTAGRTDFSDIRTMITQNHVNEADELLEGIPEGERNAEWYFLKGSIQYRMGWFEQSFENIGKATQMDPNNQEYRQAYQQMSWQRQNGAPGRPGYGGYRTNRPYEGSNQCGPCDICSGLLCADCACNCCGGDLCC